jgi:hypothetical protein
MRSLRRLARSVLRRLRPARPTAARPPVSAGRTAAPATAPSIPAIEWIHPADGSGEHRVVSFKALLGLFPPGRLLDLAAGHGLFSVTAQEMGWRATAVDARTERMPMTPGIDWVQHDVRTYDVSGFDVIALLGLLYHLELPDQLDLLRRCSGTVTILDTHHSNRPTHVEQGYAGHTFTEVAKDQEERIAETATAAWGNLTSFWATQPDLVRMLQDCGFETVLALVPPNSPDRTFYLCLPAGRNPAALPG